MVGSNSQLSQRLGQRSGSTMLWRIDPNQNSTLHTLHRRWTPIPTAKVLMHGSISSQNTARAKHVVAGLWVTKKVALSWSSAIGPPTTPHFSFTKVTNCGHLCFKAS